MQPKTILHINDPATGHSQTIGDFVFDQKTKQLVVSYAGRCSHSHFHNFVAYMAPTRNGGDPAVTTPTVYSHYGWEFQSAVSSVSMNHARGTLVFTSVGDKDPPTVLISPDVSAESTAATRFMPKDTTTIFCSAANMWDAGGKETCAAGTSSPSGVIIFSADNTGSVTSHHRNWNVDGGMTTNSDVLAVDWLDPNLLAAGERNGAVILYDIRARGGINRMRHASGILNLKRADVETRFIVAGMRGKMSLYDLRALRSSDAASYDHNYLEPRPQPPTQKQKATKRIGDVASILLRPAAQPVVTFQYENEYDMLGMAVSSELGVVAAAEVGGYVRTSSLRTGKTIKRWRIGGEGEKVACVRFVEDEMGVESVYASCGSKVFDLSIR
jgi:hypothetical protein